MSIYAIGDLQGCYRPFQRLLERLKFNPAHDQLWLVGDLVNRGDGSLECLRHVRDLGDAAITVLGNHDLNLLALADKPNALDTANDTLKPILCAPDREELLAWLRGLPLMHHDPGLRWTMVHAGLAMQWDLATAQACAHEVESVLRSENHAEFFARMYGNQPDRWNDALTGMDRLRVITNCFTRMRLCHSDGSLDLEHKGLLEDAPAQLTPWFALPGRASREHRIVFGHWSALHQIAWPEHNVWGIDSGCVWGGCMTALRLDSEPAESIQIACD